MEMKSGNTFSVFCFVAPQPLPIKYCLLLKKMKTTELLNLKGCFFRYLLWIYHPNKTSRGENREKYNITVHLSWLRSKDLFWGTPEKWRQKGSETLKHIENQLLGHGNEWKLRNAFDRLMRIFYCLLKATNAWMYEKWYRGSPLVVQNVANSPSVTFSDCISIKGQAFWRTGCAFSMKRGLR